VDEKKRLYVALLGLGHGWYTSLEVLRAAGFKRTPKYLGLLDGLVTDGLAQKRMVQYRSDGQERSEYKLLHVHMNQAQAITELLFALPRLLEYVHLNSTDKDILALVAVLAQSHGALDGISATFSDGSIYLGAKD